jgi:hypothetical protein
MDYSAGWGNRRNRDGTAPPVLNNHLWRRKTVHDRFRPRRAKERRKSRRVSERRDSAPGIEIRRVLHRKEAHR